MPSDNDDVYDGHFYPLYLEKIGFWTIRERKVKIDKSDRFNACPDCGHLWAKVILSDYKAVLKATKWQGGEQIEPPPVKSYFGLVSSILIGMFLIAIAYFKLDEYLY